MINNNIYIIEGNIGSGKTTLLKNLEKNNKNFLIIPEPINEWEPYLKKFYSNKKKFSKELQNIILSSYEKTLKYIKTHNINKIIIMERSHISSYYIFTEMFNENNFLSDNEKLELFEQYKKINNMMKLYNFIYIIIDTNIDNCIDRIKKRNNNYELKIGKKYLNNLDKKIKALSNLNFKIYTVDGNKSKKNVKEQFMKIFS